MAVLLRLIIGVPLLACGLYVLGPAWAVEARRQLSKKPGGDESSPGAEAPAAGNGDLPAGGSLSGAGHGALSGLSPAAAAREGASSRRRGDAGIALLLLALGLAVRWWGLGSQSGGMYGDEAQIMEEARKFIQGIYTTPYITDHLKLPGLYDFLLSLPLRISGTDDVTVARGFTGFLAALGVPLLYFTALELGYPRRVGILAGVVLATTFWDVIFSRMVLQNSLTATTAVATILFTVMAVRRSSLTCAALAGLSLAASFNTYLSGMMVAPVVLAWLALLAFWFGDWRVRVSLPFAAFWRRSWGSAARERPRLALLTARDELRPDLGDRRTCPWSAGVIAIAAVLFTVATIGVWPLLQLYIAPGSSLAAHATQRFILSPANRSAFALAYPGIGTSLPGLLWHQFQLTVGMFSVQGGFDSFFNIPGRPMLDPVSAFLLYVGLAGALIHLRRPHSSLVLLWFAVPIFLGVTLSTGDVLITGVPSTTRCLPALPAMCLLIAVGLDYALALPVVAWRMVAGPPRTPRWAVAARLGAVALIAAYTGIVETQRYWDWANDAGRHAVYYTAARDWSAFVGPLGPVNVTVVSPPSWPVEFGVLFAPDAHFCLGLWRTTWASCPTAQIVIFDHDLADANLYSAATHEGIVPGPSADHTVRYWYVAGASLPDPAHALHQVQ